MPKGKPRGCKACGSRIQQATTGRTRLYCDKTCASRVFYRANTGYRREAYKKLYQFHAEREKARSRERYWRVKHAHDSKRRVVTWKVVELPRVPVSFSPNFSGLGDPYDLLADYELRHLLADFEDEQGNLCLEAEQHISSQGNGDAATQARRTSNPQEAPVQLDFWDGLPSSSHTGVNFPVRRHTECWPNAPLADPFT